MAGRRDSRGAYRRGADGDGLPPLRVGPRPVVCVYVVAAVLGGSATSLVMGAVLYGVPALVVLGLGLLALWLVPARSTTDRSFEHVDAG